MTPRFATLRAVQIQFAADNLAIAGSGGDMAVRQFGGGATTKKN
ncbi:MULTISPECIES: hypothetical protein [Burkholderia]|nr:MULTISPECIES: hypothetical protein [Burkholderia]